MPVVLHLHRALTSNPAPQYLPGVALRHYQGPTDIEPWLRLRERAFARQPIGVGQWSTADFEREFVSKTWWSNERMWLAEAGRELIGAVALADRRSGEHIVPAVHWLLVDPRQRRRGVGRLLLSSLEAACWAAGHRKIWLETHAGWASALAFYQALGYRPD